MKEVIQKQRFSNIELLRIISIVLIMVVHATYCTFGSPTPEEIRTAPVKMFSYIGIENISVICVDVFVLISGWFGIHPKIKSLGGLLFQCVFFKLLIVALFDVLNVGDRTLNTYFSAIVSFPHFVYCYAVMYMLTPVFNAFVEKATKIQFRNLLIAFYAWALIFGWLLWKDEAFNAGNTTLSFIGLYLLARYIRIHTKLCEKSAKLWISCSWICVFVVTFSVWGVAYSGMNDHVANVLINITTSYLAPNVIFLSLSLLFFFNKLQFSSKLINWLSVSSFAAVFVHAAGGMENYYYPLLRWIYSMNELPVFLILSCGIMISSLIVGVLIDKIRIVMWNGCYNLGCDFLKKLKI